MIIYGEVLFLENAITGGLLLWLTGTLCGFPLKRKRCLLGALACGIYAFTLFQEELPLMLSLTEKLFFSGILIFWCFGKRRFFLGWLVFYGMSFFMGGITIGLAGLCSIPSVSCNGSYYMDQMSYLHILSGCGATVLMIRLLRDLIREKRSVDPLTKKITIIYKGRNIETEGFWDTGNRLRDPEYGLPVCLISSQLWKERFYERSELKQITYRGASGELGTLHVTDPMKVQIRDYGRVTSYPVVLGIAAAEEKQQRWGGCRVLLNGWMTADTLGEQGFDMEGETNEGIGSFVEQDPEMDLRLG